ncbi:MAG: hypothetical protein JKY53_04560, partial [Flavobacteriales bacterium]|nr:hypothetical protein [Flavobacteriales bacterium]
MQKYLFLLFIFSSIIGICQPVQIYVDYYDRDEQHMRSEGTFENGKEVGLWKYYYKSGQLKEACEYVMGGFHGRTTIWYENGQMQHQGWFKFSQQDSLYTEWNDDGKIIAQGVYDMGVKDSIWNYFYTDGELQKQSQYNNGDVKILSYWDEKGQQIITNGNGNLIEYYAPNIIKM